MPCQCRPCSRRDVVPHSQPPVYVLFTYPQQHPIGALMCERPYETTKLDDRQNRLRDVAGSVSLLRSFSKVSICKAELTRPSRSKIALHHLSDLRWAQFRRRHLRLCLDAGKN